MQFKEAVECTLWIDLKCGRIDNNETKRILLMQISGGQPIRVYSTHWHTQSKELYGWIYFNRSQIAGHHSVNIVAKNCTLLTSSNWCIVSVWCIVCSICNTHTHTHKQPLCKSFVYASRFYSTERMTSLNVVAKGVWL